MFRTRGRSEVKKSSITLLFGPDQGMLCAKVVRTDADSVSGQRGQQSLTMKMQRDQEFYGTEVPSSARKPADEGLRPMLDRIAFRIHDASHISGLSRSTLYKLIGNGKLRSVKAGGRRLILRTDLEAYFAQLRDEQQQ
jgi:excisionase family DNA binding protein